MQRLYIIYLQSTFFPLVLALRNLDPGVLVYTNPSTFNCTSRAFLLPLNTLSLFTLFTFFCERVHFFHLSHTFRALCPCTKRVRVTKYTQQRVASYFSPIVPHSHCSPGTSWSLNSTMYRFHPRLVIRPMATINLNGEVPRLQIQLHNSCLPHSRLPLLLPVADAWEGQQACVRETNKDYKRSSFVTSCTMDRSVYRGEN